MNTIRSWLQRRNNAMGTKTTVQPESVGSIMGKIGVVWGGFFAGIQLSDIVLFATLVYTALQIYILVRDKILRARPQEPEQEKK